ncbi:MAG: hypothetical protein AABX99_04350 [Nanoarchaeota archaeon]
MKTITLKEIFEKAKRKKISYDINEKTLEMIDEMVKILGISRSQLLDSLMFSGIWAQTNFCLKEWERMKKDNLKDLVHKEKKEEIEKMMKKMEEFKKKWTIDDIPHY